MQLRKEGKLYKWAFKSCANSLKGSGGWREKPEASHGIEREISTPQQIHTPPGSNWKAEPKMQSLIYKTQPKCVHLPFIINQVNTAINTPGLRLCNGNPLQYSCLENPMDGGAWCPWDCKESDTIEWLHFSYKQVLNLCWISEVQMQLDILYFGLLNQATYSHLNNVFDQHPLDCLISSYYESDTSNNTEHTSSWLQEA